MIILLNNEQYEITKISNGRITAVPFVGKPIKTTKNRLPSVVYVLSNNGVWFTVSNKDISSMFGLRWYCQSMRYIICYQQSLTGKKNAFLHNFIMKPPAGKCVDHKDRNGINNVRSNLRIATHSQNHGNKSKPRDVKNIKTSQYKGVSWDTSTAMWAGMIGCQGKQYFLGRFSSEIEAAKSYDAKAYELFGEFAFVNFPLQ